MYRNPRIISRYFNFQNGSIFNLKHLMAVKNNNVQPNNYYTRTFSSNSNDLEKNFEKAIANFTKIAGEIAEESKLKVDALCNQGNIGPCDSAKPTMSIEKGEYQAWKALGELSQADAKNQYIELVNQLLQENADKVDVEGEPHLLFEKREQVYWIRLNRPKQYNALSYEMYTGIVDALKRAAQDPAIKFTVITGNGKYFSSGNDLNNFPQAIQKFDGDIPKAMESARQICQKFVSAFVDFPKMLIGAINGPCFGIMFTTLALYDCVIATDKTFFTCPFSSLGQSPEGCSTHLFPKIFGPSMASELLYFNYRMPVEEAHRLGFVSRIVPSDKLQEHLDQWFYDNDKGLVQTCYPNSMFNAKSIVRNEETRLMLHEINKVECDFLQQSWSSEECADALQKFYSRK